MLLASTGAENHRELVALSRSQYPSVTTRPIVLFQGHSTVAENYGILFDHKHFQQKSWCLLNIMLIEWTGSEAERVTIGQMHIDAWSRLKTQ
jgi:hypothetical protein